MKTKRHAAILELVRAQRVQNQEQLRSLLRAEGIEVTQATLSRDLHELRLVKLTDPDGTVHYAPPPEASVLQPPLEQLLPTLLISLEGVGNLLVLRTPAGSANAIASAIDRQGWKDVVGTVAGDDTILIIARSERARRGVTTRIRKLAGLTP
ncbi:MAG: arginine repressor [Gemmatimonadales bacterium]|nr:arginine repressor [Gemmatimonadales bacterium]NIN10731.1 arginine repressor [Gemmatimonadales bacterium]NIQ98961.1 arginine repressor [Gemmatimonadales bacterium]NIS63780.1 arginine repressor [Gemmatimonadales bacterium]